MLRTALSCLLVLFAVAVFGAEAEAPTPAVPGEGSTETGSATPDEIDAALAEEIRAAEEAAAAAPPAKTDEPFIPSVQISEDLSVSFPVDI